MKLKDFRTSTLILTVEELEFILRHLGINSLPGMQPLQLLVDDETNAHSLDLIKRVLVVRKLLVPDENNRLKLDRALLAVISICANPEQISSVTFQYGQDSLQQKYYYRVPELIISRSSIMSGIYEFEASTKIDMGWSMIEHELKQIESCSHYSPTYIVDTQILKEVQILVTAKNQINIAINQLEKSGVSSEDSERFVNTLHNPAITAIIQFVDKQNPEADRNLFTLVANRTDCWLGQSTQTNSPTIRLQCLASDEVKQVLFAAYNPLVRLE